MGLNSCWSIRLALSTFLACAKLVADNNGDTLRRCGSQPDHSARLKCPSLLAKSLLITPTMSPAPASPLPAISSDKSKMNSTPFPANSQRERRQEFSRQGTCIIRQLDLPSLTKQFALCYLGFDNFETESSSTRRTNRYGRSRRFSGSVNVCVNISDSSLL